MSRSRLMGAALLVGLGGAASGSSSSWAAPPQEAAPQEPPADQEQPAGEQEPAPGEAQPAPEPTQDEPEEATYTPPASAAAAPAVMVNGYVDVGFANVQGNGTSYRTGDTRIPADYAVDTFAPAVNSRGDVASIDSDGRFTNGFLPRSMGIGGRPSFLFNTADLDFQYRAPGIPVTVFSRIQVLPRPLDDLDQTRVYVEQAFGRVTPFASQELTITVGKSDAVFGIEYLENQANFRVGVTPSLIARYTTAPPLGVKAFYRLQIASLWSAVSLNMAATNGANMAESLQVAEVSLTGRPVGSGRFGYELNLPRVQVKLGASGSYGPRNDQMDRRSLQRMWGADARLVVGGAYLAAEYLQIYQDEGGLGGKTTGMGDYPIATEFYARGFYVFLAYGLDVGIPALRRITPYGRYERRHADFEGFLDLTVDRVTAGLRLDLWESVILKGEYLVNRELEGAPRVSNNVFTTSAVFSW